MSIFNAAMSGGKTPSLLPTALILTIRFLSCNDRHYNSVIFAC
jgi:hypothetical protein